MNKISSGDYSEKELINLKNNAIRLGHQDIADVVELQMRKQFPRAASKQFGAKGDFAQLKLEAADKEISSAFDLSKNRNNNGVKVGGGIMSGESYIDYYLSYKNDEGLGAFLGLIQETVDSELKVRVGLYKTGKDRFDEALFFVMDDFSKAVGLYKTHLTKISSA